MSTECILYYISAVSGLPTTKPVFPFSLSLHISTNDGKGVLYRVLSANEVSTCCTSNAVSILCTSFVVVRNMTLSSQYLFQISIDSIVGLIEVSFLFEELRIGCILLGVKGVHFAKLPIMLLSSEVRRLRRRRVLSKR